jgi:chromosome segregation protein
MKLLSLRLHGFKSFADRTTLDFREGVTAIIGSNGCGKSNIADSIRWVLGEQRASAIRGSKMEEVIFQGTARRRPVNLAEVVLVFDNQSGRVAVPQTEIEVARKVFREGGSEYSLNRNPCRLRDVTGLLRDTGLGSNAYAIIEAGMIETLLSDRAEERRMLFEEAAGIGRYKDSRHAATRRLEAAEADLARLQDLLGEVESKVRTLARQKRRAERHRELQARRLDLEVAIARAEIESIGAELGAGELRRAELQESTRSAATERTTAEALVEERRLEAATLARSRAEAAERLEQVRRQLDAREREVLVADERRTHATLRIEQLVRERSELAERIASLASEVERSSEAQHRQRGVLETLRERLEERSEENRSVRHSVQAERAASDAAAARARDLTREIAGAEGERAAAERRRREAEERLTNLSGSREALSSQLGDLSEQTELWAVRSDEVQGLLDEATERVAYLQEKLAAERAREQAARERLRTAEDEVTRLGAQLEAREAFERGYEGFSPAVAAIMAARGRFPGVLGPLADFVGAGAGAVRAPEVEIFLGSLLQALVVADLATARMLRDWFRDEWDEGGTLTLLPLRGNDGSDQGSDVLPTRAELWVERLLADLRPEDGDPLVRAVPGEARVGREGEMMDARGVVRLTRGTGEGGILARREEVVRLRAGVERAAAEHDLASRERDGVRRSLAEVEQSLLEAEERRRVHEAELRRVEMDTAAHQHHRGRLQRDRDTLEQTLASLERTIAESAAAITKVEARLVRLSDEVTSSGADDTRARERLAELEAVWEEARDQESELRVAVARAESDLRETERRLGSARNASLSAADRLAEIDREAGELRGSLEGLAGVRERAGDQIQELFGTRDREAAALSLVDARLAEVDSELAELGERVRAARRGETESGEEGHRLDLAIADLRSRLERARERLEVEWGRPWDALVASASPVEDGDPEQWRRELRATGVQLEGIGPVNMLAVEEHEEEERRLAFLESQRADLVGARDDLLNAIRQINRTAREVFMETFTAVRENFQRVFQSLFQGGECDLWLATPDDPLESAIEIQASPKGKRTQRIHLLSGGERTLTALALLFALYLVKPSPFCVLDEVDAPLDESNVARFLHLLHDFKAETQFIVITHNPRTMEAADWVYGVTMEEPGVSTIVGVEMLRDWVGGSAVAVNT